MANFDKKCGAFSTLYILIKMPSGEDYQSAMFSNTSIANWECKVDLVQISLCIEGQ